MRRNVEMLNLSFEDKMRILEFPDLDPRALREQREFEAVTVLQPDGTRCWKELGEC